MAHVCAMAMQKGGVGNNKTTTAVSGARVLLIDIDPQANATQALGIDLESIDVNLFILWVFRCFGESARLP